MLNASAGIDFHPALTQLAITMQIQLPIKSKHYSMSDYKYLMALSNLADYLHSCIKWKVLTPDINEGKSIKCD